MDSLTNAQGKSGRIPSVDMEWRFQHVRNRQAAVPAIRVGVVRRPIDAEGAADYLFSATSADCGHSGFQAMNKVLQVFPAQL